MSLVLQVYSGLSENMMFVYLAIALVHIHVSYIGYPGYLPLFVDYTWRTSASCRFCTLKVISWISANNSRDSEIIRDDFV